MFLNDMLLDYSFDDIKFVFDNDKYFLYVKDRYDLSVSDETLFNNLLDAKNHPEFENKITSLEVITVRKSGLLSRVELSDVEDERRSLITFPLHEIVGFPVDMYYSSNDKRALRLIISLLLEFSFYKDMDSLTKSKRKN